MVVVVVLVITHSYLLFPEFHVQVPLQWLSQKVLKLLFNES